jgi:hypothetical protein
VDVADGLFCYPQCKDGYLGVGPMCWEDFVGNELTKGMGVTRRRGR